MPSFGRFNGGSLGGDNQSGGSVSRAMRPRVYARLPIGNDSEAVGTGVHDGCYYLPFGGQTIQVRCVYRNQSTTTQMVTADSAATSGRSWDDINPLTESGAASPFVAVGSGKTIDVAPSAPWPESAALIG